MPIEYYAFIDIGSNTAYLYQCEIGSTPQQTHSFQPKNSTNTVVNCRYLWFDPISSQYIAIDADTIYLYNSQGVYIADHVTTGITSASFGGSENLTTSGELIICISPTVNTYATSASFLNTSLSVLRTITNFGNGTPKTPLTNVLCGAISRGFYYLAEGQVVIQYDGIYSFNTGLGPAGSSITSMFVYHEETVYGVFSNGPSYTVGKYELTTAGQDAVTQPTLVEIYNCVYDKATNQLRTSCADLTNNVKILDPTTLQTTSSINFTPLVCQYLGYTTGPTPPPPPPPPPPTPTPNITQSSKVNSDFNLFYTNFTGLGNIGYYF